MKKKSFDNSNENGASRNTAYQRGNQRDGSPHYVFLYSDDENDDESIPLKPRKTNNILPRKVEVINIDIKPDDTLQALALRYRCTVSELKRINNIHRDNEIYARRLLKVPVKPFSIFTEVHSDVPLIDLEPDRSNSVEQQVIDAIENLSAPQSTFSTSDSINTVILNSLCEPTTNNNDEACVFEDEESNLLVQSNDRESTLEASVLNSFKCSGADWGLSWTQLLGVSLVLGMLGIVLPVFYIFHIMTNNVNTNT